jgi:hypothetical protein
MLALTFGLLVDAIQLGTGALLLFLLLRLLLRRDGLATGAFLLVLTAIQMVNLVGDLGRAPWLLVSLSLLIMGSYTWLLLRFGLLSAIAGMYVLHVLLAFPLTTELGSWKGGPTVFLMLLLVTLAMAAFRTSVAPGLPLSRRPLDD